MRSLAEDLAARRAVARLGGGEEKIGRRHAAGKLTARERIALLFDAGTFTELGDLTPSRTSASARWTAGRPPPTG